MESGGRQHDANLKGFARGVLIPHTSRVTEEEKGYRVLMRRSSAPRVVTVNN